MQALFRKRVSRRNAVTGDCLKSGKEARAIYRLIAFGTSFQKEAIEA